MTTLTRLRPTWASGREAMRKAKTYVLAYVHLRDPDKVPAIDGESITVYLSPLPSRIGFIPRARCPRWLRARLEDVYYSPTYNGRGHETEKTKIEEAYGFITELILERERHVPYVQSQLPF